MLEVKPSCARFPWRPKSEPAGWRWGPGRRILDFATRLLACTVFVGFMPAAEPAPRNQPPVPPLSPEESRQRVRLPPGYVAEIVAAEPLVLDPVAFDWDEHGRLWVVEMADYPNGMDDKGAPGGRVRILVDTDGDGRYDRATLFAEGLSFPTGILTWRDGCLITAAPEILFLRDEDGDGRAEKRAPLFTGFNTGNQQLRINGLRWGLDGWVYCANGGHHVNYGKEVSVRSVRTGEQIALGARDFRFRPDTGELDPLSGPAQFGRTRDAWGRWFGVQNSYPLWHYVLEDRHLRRNPHVAPPNPKVLLTEGNPPVYPALPPEKRYHSFSQAGRYTSACSALIVGDPLLFDWSGPTGRQHALICEPVHNLVQHLVLEPDGFSFNATRSPGELDFFASEDRWCRPVMVRTGPDGALWLADMYRYMIEHPHWLPNHGRNELLPHYRSGDDRGRIYRIFPEKDRPAAVPRVPLQDLAALVALLGSPNRWLRDKAQMLLDWQRDPAAVPALTKLAQNETNPLGRVHALHALEHLGALNDELLVAAFRDAEPGVREQALGLAERRTGEAVVRAAAALVKDPSPKVRLQLACALGEWKQPVAGQALLTLARDATNPILRGAIASSLRPHLDAFAALAHGDEELLDALFQTALGEHRPDVILTLLERAFAAAGPADDTSLRRVRDLLIHLRARSLSLEALADRHPIEPRWARLVQRKQEVFATVNRDLPKAPVARQAFYATVLLADPPEQTAALELLERLLAPQHALHPLAEYVNHLARLDDPRVPDVLLRHWDQRTPGDRALILDAIMSREAWVPGLLARIGDGSIKASSFDAQRQARLVRHPSPEIRRRAGAAFTATSDRSRPQVIEAYRPALALPGDAAKGRRVFTQICAACHELEGTGVALGPDLRSVIDHPAEKLLVSIIDPSADIQPGFAAYFCELKTGEQLYGSIAAETGGSLDFRLADGSTRAILRSEIRSLQSSNVSLMPEGLEASLTPQGLADLIAYLKAAK